MMGITYATTVAMPGDPFPVLIRKMAQKLGVTVDVGDNVYKVMWKILADQSWSLGTTQSFVNVANQNVVYSTLPFHGDTLNVLFLKFAQRTGYVIITRNGIGGTQAVGVLREILDPATVPGGGVTPPTPPDGGGGTGVFYTLTYVNDFGAVNGVNPQIVEGNLSGSAVTAVIDASMSVSFTQWDDGGTNLSRTDVVTADATYTVQAAEDSFVGDSEDSMTDRTPGETLEDTPYEGVAGWWGSWRITPEMKALVADSFDLKTLASSLIGQTAEYAYSGTLTWVSYMPSRTEIVGDDFESKTVASNLNGQDDLYGNTWVVI